MSRGSWAAAAWDWQASQALVAAKLFQPAAWSRSFLRHGKTRQVIPDGLLEWSLAGVSPTPVFFFLLILGNFACPRTRVEEREDEGSEDGWRRGMMIFFLGFFGYFYIHCPSRPHLPSFHLLNRRLFHFLTRNFTLKKHSLLLQWLDSSKPT